MEITIRTDSSDLYHNLTAGLQNVMDGQMQEELLFFHAHTEEELSASLSLALPSLVFLSLDDPLSAFAQARQIWKDWPECRLIFTARHPEEIFPALSLPFYHVVRAFSLGPDLKAVAQKFLREQKKTPRSALFHAGNQVICLKQTEILYLESQRHTISIHCLHQDVTVSDTLSSCEMQLREWHFLRIHKSFLVNPRFIRSLGKDSLLLENGTRLYISRYRYPEVKLQFEQYIRHLEWL